MRSIAGGAEETYNRVPHKGWLVAGHMCITLRLARAYFEQMMMADDHPNHVRPFDFLRDASLSSQEFAQRLKRSGLVDKQTIHEAWKTLSDDDRSPAGLAQALAGGSKLTPFQARRIAEEPEPLLVLGSYVIQDKLGEGGMGQVFRAVHRKMKREVALKVISSSVLKDVHSIARFNREVEAAAKLSHPHIVTAFDAGESGGVHYLVMEYIVGVDLSSRVRTHGVMTLRDAVQVTLQAARGLAYAHSRGIVHRDIKPSNLLIDRQGVVRVLDLGLARIDHSDSASAVEGLTNTGVVMGTVDYMAPEQAMDSKAADARSDIYSLGCTFFYLLTGRSVFGGDTLVKRLLAHRDQPAPALTDLNLPATPRLEAVYARMLAKRPADRFQTMSDVVREFEAVLAEMHAPHDHSDAENGGLDPTICLATPLAALAHEGAYGGLPPTMTVQPATSDASLDATLSTSPTEDTLKIHDQLAFIEKLNTPVLRTPVQRSTGRLKRQSLPMLLSAAGVLGMLSVGGLLYVAQPSKDIPLTDSQPASGPPLSPSVTERSLAMDLPAAPAEAMMPAIEDDEVNAGDERAAAQWLATSLVSGYVRLRTDDGALHEVTPEQTALPDEPFTIEAIRFSGGQIDDVGLQHLSRCRRLKEVAIGRTVFAADVAELTWLRHARHLERLEFEGVPIDDRIWANLGQWPVLSHLRIADCPEISDASSITVDSHPALAAVELPGSSLTDESIFVLASRLPGLNHLDVSQHADQSLRTLSPLSQLPNLVHLGCSPNQLTSEGLATLTQYPHVVSLDVHGPVTKETIQGILSLREQLQRLSLTTSEATDSPIAAESFRDLIGCNHLSSIRITGLQGSPTDADLVVLASLPQLQQMELAFDDSAVADVTSSGRRYTGGGIEAFRGLRPDVELKIDGNDYPASVSFGSVAIPSLGPSMPDPPPMPSSAPAEPQLAAPADSPRSVLAAPEVRLADIDQAVPVPNRRMLKVGEPLGAFAAVTRPGRLSGVASWSVEPIRHRGQVQCLDASCDGLVASGGHDTTVRIWTRDGELVRVLAGHFNTVASVAFSPDGKWLASVSVAPQSQVAIWNVANGALVKAFSTQNWFGRLAWSHDGSRLAHAASSRLEIYDTTSWAVVQSERTYSYPSEVAWSPDDRRLFLACGQESAGFLIDAATMAPIKEIPLNSGLYAVSWSGDGRLIAVGHSRGISVAETQSFSTVQTLEGQEIGGVKFSPDSTRLAAAGDGGIRLFSTKDWSEIDVGGIHSFTVCWSRDGERLLSTAPWYDLAAKTSVANPLTSGTHQVRLAAAPSGRRLATRTRTRLRLWDGDSGQLLKEQEIPAENVSQMAWQSGGNLFFQISRNESESLDRLELVDGETARTVTTLQGHSQTIWSAAWSPDGRQLASVSEDGTCRLWDPQTGEALSTLAHGAPLWWIVWSPDSTRLATGSAFSVISVWDVKAGKLLQTFKTLSENLIPPTTKGYTDDAPFAFTRDPNQICVSGKASSFELLNVSNGTITPLGNVTLRNGGGGTPYGIHWTNEYRSIGVVTSYLELNLYTLGNQEGMSVFRFMSPHWLEDGRRVVGGDNFATNVYGIDLRNHRRLGTLLPEMEENAWAAISYDGHVRGSQGLANHVAVALTLTDGRNFTMTPQEFAERFKWKNDVTKVRFLK